MAIRFLTNKNLKLILFGGKGGSGKTTSATAAALQLAQTTQQKILVVSTDPAPSIGDSFDFEVGNKLTKIQDKVWALEMDAQELMEDFRKKHLETIKTLFDRGTYLGREDIEEFINKPFPGMDEVMAVIKIADLIKEGKYDLIILDTAPTGHTKVLLTLPQAMKRWLKVGELMMAKHRFMMRQIRGKYIKDQCDKFLENITEDVGRVNRLLKDQETTEFVPVTIPEPMSILETEALVKDLQILEIKVKSIIINRVVMVEERCPLCPARMKRQEKYLKMIEERLKGCQFIKMPLWPTEIRGKTALTEYGQVLFGEKQFEITLPKARAKFPGIPQGKMAEFLKRDLSFVICGGKGGVGKTSVAAATALAFAKKYKDKKVLVTTTDPAHALANIFDQHIPLGKGAVSIKGLNNLDAIEIDTQQLHQKFKDEYRQDTQEAFKKLVKGAEVAFDQKVIEELIDLSPPGLEELMALRKVMELIKEGQYDIYVLDTAASGHLLRFLETPDIVRDWLKSIFRILLRYREVAGLTKLKARLLDLSKDVKKVQETLFGSKTTEFIMISIAEEMGIREMGDLGQSLEKLNLPYHYLILNMIYPVSPCKFCLAKRENQEIYISKVKKEYPKKEIVLIPLFSHDIRGLKSLQELSAFIFG